MSYFCETPGCLFHAKKWPYPVAGNCPECGQPFVLKVEFDAFETDVINNYPYVIAFPFKRMLEETHYFTKFSILKDVFVNTLKYNALLVATEYFKSPYKSEKINTLFVNKLSRPFHGNWNEFLEVTIDFLEQKNYSFFVGQLPFAYHAIETGKKNNIVKRYEVSKVFTNHSGRLKTEKKQLTAIRALLDYRNEMMAHRQTLDNDTFKKLYYTCYIILKDFLQAIAFCKDYPMYKADRLYYWSLMGTEVKQAGRLTTAVSKDENVWIQDVNGNRLSLLPFFVQPSQYIAGTNDAMQVLMYEGNTGPGGRIIFDSPESFKPEAEGEIVNKFYELLQNKQVLYSYDVKNFTKEKLKLQIDILNRKVFRELKEEQKLVEGIYQKREDAEVALLSWVGAKAGLFFLAADAGTGKTNLLWEMQRRYKEWGIDAVMIRAAMLKEDDLTQQLIYIFHLADNFSFSGCEAFTYKQNKPLVLLIDGGNETANPEKLLQSIQAFLQQFTIGTVKVVITWRANTQNDVPVLDASWNELYYNANATANPDGNLQKRHYWLQPLNKVELQSAWNNYVQHPTKIKYRVPFTLNELTIADKPLADQLHNPLLLKLFLELYSGKELSSIPKGFTNIWAIWWKRHIAKEPTNANFLLQLAVLMANNQTNRLPLNSLYEDEIIGKHIRNYQIDNPYQQLLNSNVLTQFSINNSLFVAFTIESVFHYALCQYLLQQPNTASSLADYAAKGQQWQQAVVFYLWDAVCKNKTDKLIELIKTKSIDTAITAKPLAHALQVINTEKLVELLLRNAGEKEWAVLRKAIDTIREAQKMELVTHVLRESIKLTNFSIFACCDLFSDYLKELSNIESKDVVDDFCERFLTTNDLMLKITLVDGITAYYEVYDTDSNKKLNEFAEIYLTLCIEKYGIESETTATAYARLGLCKRKNGKYEEALKLFNKVLEIFLLIYGTDNNFIATTYLHIAQNCPRRLRNNETLKFQKKALEIYLKLYGSVHTFIATTYNQIAHTYFNQSQFDEALKYHRSALSIDEIFYGLEHPNIGLHYSNIASILMQQNKFEDAIKYYNKSLNIDLKFYGEEHPNVIKTLLYSLVEGHEKCNNLTEILLTYNKALEIQKRKLGNNHPDIARLHKDIGDTFIKMGNLEKAMSSFLKAKEIMETFYDEDDYQIADLQNSLGFYYEKKGELKTALNYYENAYKKRLIIFGPENQFVKNILVNIERVK